MTLTQTSCTYFYAFVILLSYFGVPSVSAEEQGLPPSMETRIQIPSTPNINDAPDDVEDPLAPDKSSAPLSAKLTIEELTGNASISPGSHLLKITVVNSGKRALLLDGDNLVYSNSNGSQTPLAKEQIISPPSKNTLPGDTLEVATSISTGGTLPVTVDVINKAKNPGPAFYGRDEKRRDLAEQRFGKRLLFPGETSSGELYFDKATSEQGQLTIPVFSHPDGADLGKLNLNVSMSAPQAVPTPPRKERGKETEAQRLPGELEKSLEKKQRAEGKAQSN